MKFGDLIFVKHEVTVKNPREYKNERYLRYDRKLYGDVLLKLLEIL